MPRQGPGLVAQEVSSEMQSRELGLFLDECLQVCEVMQVAAERGLPNGTELHRIFHDLPRLNHRLHLPQKLENLSDGLP